MDHLPPKEDCQHGEHNHRVPPSFPMLPGGTEDNEVVYITPMNGKNGKILIREDTILANLQGCAGCGRAQFACQGVKHSWSSLCWGQNSYRNSYCLKWTLWTTFAMSLLGTVLMCFTSLLDNAILSSMVLRNNSMSYQMWRRPAVHPLMKVHLFNYSNWKDVRDGRAERFHVDDVGPYVYSQVVERVNVRFEGDSLTFQEHNSFTFVPELSRGNPYTDHVSVPNLPLLGALSLMQYNEMMSVTMNMYINNPFNSNNPQAFNWLDVHSFLWGYDDPIIDLVKPVMSLMGQFKFDKFGLLVTKNGTVSDVLTINTGVEDKDRMNIVEQLDGKPSLSYWSDSRCNSIEGSDGSLFPPVLLDRTSKLNVFFPNLCRRLPFEYERDVESKDGIQLLRYKLPRNVFDDPVSNPENSCFCEPTGGTCPPKGVINVTACSLGVPALVSFPHFHLGDPRLSERFEGLQPNPELHEGFLDVHPKLGISLNGKSSMQLNIQVKKSSLIGLLNFLPQDIVLPIAWLDIVIEDLPDSVKSLVYHGTYSTAAVQLGLTVCCVLALIISSLGLFVSIVCKKPKPCATLKVLAENRNPVP